MSSSGLKPTAGFLFGMAAEAATDLQKTGVHDEIAISGLASKAVVIKQDFVLFCGGVRAFMTVF